MNRLSVIAYISAAFLGILHADAPPHVASLQLNPKSKEGPNSLSLYVTDVGEGYVVRYTAIERNGAIGQRATLIKGFRNLARFDVFWPSGERVWCRIHATLSVPVQVTVPGTHMIARGTRGSERLPLVL